MFNFNIELKQGLEKPDYIIRFYKPEYLKENTNSIFINLEYKDRNIVEHSENIIQEFIERIKEIKNLKMKLNLNKNINNNLDLNEKLDENENLNKDLDVDKDLNENENINKNENLDLNENKNLNENENLDENVDKNINLNENINKNLNKDLDIINNLNKDINNNLNEIEIKIEYLKHNDLKFFRILKNILIEYKALYGMTTYNYKYNIEETYINSDSLNYYCNCEIYNPKYNIEGYYIYNSISYSLGENYRNYCIYNLLHNEFKYAILLYMALDEDNFKYNFHYICHTDSNIDNDEEYISYNILSLIKYYSRVYNILNEDINELKEINFNNIEEDLKKKENLKKNMKEYEKMKERIKQLENENSELKIKNEKLKNENVDLYSQLI